MLFNSYAFLMVFLPLVLALYLFFSRRSSRLFILIVSSLIFYGMSGLEHAIILVAGLVWIYALTSGRIEGRRLKLGLAIAGPMAGLIYYKYLSFILVDLIRLDPEAAAGIATAVDSSLPAGISFFTFQMMAYAIDRYRGDIPDKPDFKSFATYISMFPQLIAGPILRYRDISGTLRDISGVKFSQERTMTGVYYIVFGLGAKVLIADTLARALGPAIGQPGDLVALEAGFVIFAYSFQIYFDFYGYSLIAIGIGKLLGFDFPVNFLRPYESNNPRDFWRRWHTTLSFWIRDYLYLPLGGNRAYIRNIVIVFAVCGLWHGAGLNFVIWGLYHGMLVAGHKYIEGIWKWLPLLAQRAITFCLISVGWTLFLYDFSGAMALLSSLSNISELSGTAVSAVGWSSLVVAAAVCFGLNFEAIIERAVTRHSISFASLFGASLVLSMIFLDRSTSFIYFRF